MRPVTPLVEAAAGRALHVAGEGELVVALQPERAALGDELLVAPLEAGHARRVGCGHENGGAERAKRGWRHDARLVRHGGRQRHWRHADGHARVVQHARHGEVGVHVEAALFHRELVPDALHCRIGAVMQKGARIDVPVLQATHLHLEEVLDNVVARVNERQLRRRAAHLDDPHRPRRPRCARACAVFEQVAEGKVDARPCVTRLLLSRDDARRVRLDKVERVLVREEQRAHLLDDGAARRVREDAHAGGRLHPDGEAVPVLLVVPEQHLCVLDKREQRLGSGLWVVGQRGDAGGAPLGPQLRGERVSDWWRQRREDALGPLVHVQPRARRARVDQQPKLGVVAHGLRAKGDERVLARLGRLVNARLGRRRRGGRR
mmetsp:Transcript_13717/g.42892  ORF Transcript_13717/g.42892 Transcript_13717/m.42892 type:complete len:376 (-) Transcript_13717:20-1147(-)